MVKDITSFERSRRIPVLKIGNATTNNAFTFTKNDTATAIAHANASITATTAAQLKSATVELTNAKTDDAMTSTATLTDTGIVASVDTETSGKIFVNFTGDSSFANYLTALKGVKIENTADIPDGTDRSIIVKINNGNDESSAATVTVTVKMTPELAIGDAAVNNTGAFVKGDSALAIAHANSTLAAVPSTITSMTVELTNAKTDDAMTSTATLTDTGISAAVDTATPGKIFVNFTGSSSTTNYLTAIKGVKFNNTAEAPDTTSRVINVTCTNGVTSNTATATITVAAA